MHRVLSHIAPFTQKINTIKSDFAGERAEYVIGENYFWKGKFGLRENAVRMEYTNPFQYLMIINGRKIYIKDSQKENKVSAKSTSFEQINKIMMDCARNGIE